jgi:hypothetical protein
VKAWPRTAIRVAGWLLSLLALGFFARLVLRQGLALPEDSRGQIFAILALSSLAYGAMVALLALIWSGFAADSRPASGSAARLFPAYLTSQFAKYIPGNIFQFAARHAMGRQLGLDHASLGFAAVAEASLLVGAAVAIVIAQGQTALQTFFPKLPHIPNWSAGVLLLGCVAVWSAPLPRIARWLPRYPWQKVSVAILGYLLFFALFGLIFYVILHRTTPLQPDITRVVTHGSLAWLVGFVVPGAPAGAGMREAVLALAAGEQGRTSAVLTAILLFRLVTLIGDFLALCAGLSLQRAIGRATARTAPSSTLR